MSEEPRQPSKDTEALAQEALNSRIGWLVSALQAKLAEGDPDRWDKITDVLSQDYAQGVEVAGPLAEEATDDERRDWAEATQRDVYAQCLAAASAIQSVWGTVSVDPIPQTFTLAEVVALFSGMLKTELADEEPDPGGAG
jgi:hypothetical protein